MPGLTKTPPPPEKQVADANLKDNTRISTYKACPRKYFFRHVLDWAPEKTGAALVFGQAWHSAMDVLWEMMAKNPDHDPSEVAHTAFLAFELKWTEYDFPALNDMTEEQQARLGARTPATAYEMLFHYVIQRRTFFTEIELLNIERPFAIPLDPNNPALWYVGRIDKEFRWKHDGRTYYGEHKTTSAYKKDGFFRTDWVNSWSPNSQIQGYEFEGHVTHGKDFNGIWIDGALVHKTVHEGFTFIRHKSSLDQLDAWLWEAHSWIERIAEDEKLLGTHLEGLQQTTGPVPYLPAFPKNTGECQSFAGCVYLDLCQMWPNPLGRETPPGYERNPWSPFDVLELEKIGFRLEKGVV